MRILFTTGARESVSTQLNAPNYARLNDLEGVTIDFYNHNYADYDVVLFMGYDPRVAEARNARPSLKIGVIDPRPVGMEQAVGADFVIANGLEMQDWLADYFENIFIYPIYPQVNSSRRKHAQSSPLIIGYHGNKVHLASAVPYLTAALDALSRDYNLELWVVYDIRSLGELPTEFFQLKNIKIRYFQWEQDVYERVISKVDIGVVPNLIPLKNESWSRSYAIPFSPYVSHHESDYLIRFKNTTNAGRIYVFSQLAIPVVAGMAPSAVQAIQHGVNGYLAFGAGGWYHGLKNLADSVELRQQMGELLYASFQENFSPGVLNQRLVRFLTDLPTRSSQKWNPPKKVLVSYKPSGFQTEKMKNVFRKIKCFFSL